LSTLAAYEMMHTADTQSELRSDEERLAQALEAWRAYLEASRRHDDIIRRPNLHRIARTPRVH
jgi:hypothetical protein